MKKFIVFFLLCMVLVVPTFGQQTASKALSIVVGSSPVVITQTSLPNGMVGLAYTTTITASGGLGPYTYSVSAGTLPVGLTLTTGGVLSGTPTTSGPVTFTIKATDSEAVAQTATQSFTVTVLAQLLITNTSLPAANLGVAYSAIITATGGTTPYTFTVSAGSLPTGLTINAATGTISGTPTLAGTFNFTITVTDSSNNVVQIQGYSKVIVAQNHQKSPKKGV